MWAGPTRPGESLWAGPTLKKKIKGATFCQLFKYCDYANLIETNNGGKNE